MGDDIFGLVVFRIEGKQSKRMRTRTRHARAIDRANARMREEES
jgi:hypothetical protein